MASPNTLKLRKQQAKLRPTVEQVKVDHGNRQVSRTPAPQGLQRYRPQGRLQKRYLRRLRFAFDPPLTYKGQQVGETDDGEPIYELLPQQTAMREKRTKMKAEGRPPTVRSQRVARKMLRRSRS